MTDSTNICYDTITLFISYPQIDNIIEINPTCGSSNGSLDASASGGAGGYTYSIDNGLNFQPTGTFSGLGINNYTVILVDQNNCSDTMQAALIGVDSVEISNMVVTTTTCGLDNGIIDLTITGGTPTYQYSLTNGSTFSASPVFNNLVPGTYQVYVEDVNGCFDSTTATI